MSPLGKTATNERIKLTASSVNTIGLAIGLTGGVIPTIGLFLPDAPTPSTARLTVSLFGIAIGTLIHLGARALLRRLEE